MEEEPLEAPIEHPATEGVARLRYMDATGPTERVFELRDDNLIGRYDPAVCEVDVDLTEFPDSKFVSRRHARIRREGEQWLLSDLGSGNGTFLYRGPDVQPERVGEEAPIADGDEIAFGNIRCRFEVTATEPAD
ncbi:MAG: FHA domain-containing protein [Fimbriimonadia bacterium]